MVRLQSLRPFSYLLRGPHPSSRCYLRFQAHLPLYQAQFSRPANAEGLMSGRVCPSCTLIPFLNLPSSGHADGNSDFFAYSTGRRALASLHTTFTLRPRHDLLQVVYQFVRGIVELDYVVQDKVDLEFTFREPVGKEGAIPEAVWAIVSKEEMKRLRNDRWDLVRFATHLVTTLH